MILTECRRVSEFCELKVFLGTKGKPWMFARQRDALVIATQQRLEFLRAEETGRSLTVGVIFDFDVIGAKWWIRT